MYNLITINKERRNPMEKILETLKEDLIYAKAKVDVIEDLLAKFTPTETEIEEDYTDFPDETQPTVTSAF